MDGARVRGEFGRIFKITSSFRIAACALCVRTAFCTSLVFRAGVDTRPMRCGAQRER